MVDAEPSIAASQASYNLFPEVCFKEKAKTILSDSTKSRALRDLLTCADNEVEADGFISTYSGEKKLPGGDGYTEQMQSLINKEAFISELYGGRLNKLASCNHPDATDDEILYYDYWFKLSAATKFGWG